MENPKIFKEIINSFIQVFLSFDLLTTIVNSYACAINTGPTVLLTGGELPGQKGWKDHGVGVGVVDEYNEDGPTGRVLPQLLVARSYHGCTAYDNDEGTKVRNNNL